MRNHILKSVAIGVLYIMIQPETLAELFGSTLVFMVAMFADYFPVEEEDG